MAQIMEAEPGDKFSAVIKLTVSFFQETHDDRRGPNVVLDDHVSESRLSAS
jgi:hypothetical protein